MTDTPRVWCPGCEPKADEWDDLLEIQYCGDHVPDRAGEDDRLVSCGFDVISDAAVNRAFCALLHGTRS